MVKFELQTFAVLEEILIVRGIVEHSAPVRNVFVVFSGGDSVSGEIISEKVQPDPPTLWSEFKAVVQLTTDRRASLEAVKLDVEFGDGSVETISDIRQQRLVEESFWNTANSFFGEIGSRKTGRLLEVGSRARSGVTRREYIPPGWDYVGVDIADGPNVDRLGDAHKLSQLFPKEHFEAVMAFALLEHLMMPWKFLVELNRVLKVGAVGLFVTHQAWPVHEGPWDFYRFSEWAWHSLLNKATGFEILEAKTREPAYLVSKVWHPAVDHRTYMCYQSSTTYFRKISNTDLDWPVSVEGITDTMYPD